MGLKDSSKLGSKDSKLRPKDTKLKLASLRLDTSLVATKIFNFLFVGHTHCKK